MYNDNDRGNEHIKCSVVDCNYNNEKGKCTLPTIQIRNVRDQFNINSFNNNTICNSYCPSTNFDYEMAEEITNNLQM